MAESARTDAADQSSEATKSRRQLAVTIATAGLLLLCVSLCAVSASADDPAAPALPTSEEVTHAIENGSSRSIVPRLTDPRAAEGVAHRDLGRDEALELLQGVFEPELQSPAGIFDDLHVEKFLAPNVAVIEAGEQPEAPTLDTDEEGKGGYEGATLMDSTVPLATEAPSGRQEAVDLGLEHTEGELQSANPLVEVGIPQELGDGIELPESGVTIELPGAPEERAPSTVDGSVAAYPNIARDTDMAVAPTPTGLETLTQMRSAESPRSQTFKLKLPDGASLQGEDGGAKVTREGEMLLGIVPPTALDASGAEVPVSMTVSGDSLTLTVSPKETTQYPILVDPLFQTFEWYAKHNEALMSWFWGYEGWDPKQVSTGSDFILGHWVNEGSGAPVPPLTAGTPGLAVQSLQSTKVGDEAFYVYTVPRYFSDPAQHEGNEPQSFISKMTVSDLIWKANSEAKSPYVYMGLWGPSTGWNASLYSHEGLKEHGLNNMSWVYTLTNELSAPDVQLAEIGMHSNENVFQAWAYLYAGAVTVELGEPSKVVPTFSFVSGPEVWLNQMQVPINFKVTDPGLGVSSVTVAGEQGLPSWKSAYGCTGVAGSPCPYTWQSDVAHPGPNIRPAELPQGIDKLKVTAEDPLGRVSSVSQIPVNVDHTAPQLAALSGTATEQATLGTKLPKYTLKLSATDGTTESPQSGVAKTEIKIDGKLVNSEAPGCATKNCSVSREWTLQSLQYGSGQHTVEVIATDAVGLTSTRTLGIALDVDDVPPNIALSGTMTEQATLGATRPRYSLKSSVSDATKLGGSPLFASSFGSAGSSNGQFSSAAGITADSAGNIWVADTGNSRVQEFSSQGTYIRQFGAKGTGDGQFSVPEGITTDPEGHIWVADTGNHRVQEFSSQGTYIRQFGAKGTGNGQFALPFGITTDPEGHIWVADTGNSRVQEFDASGTYIRQFGAKGTGNGQLSSPEGMAADSAGNIWVADTGNSRVQEFNSQGNYIRQFGVNGTGNGQLSSPRGIAADSAGNIWVADTGNSRVQEFSSQGTYIRQFGAKGTGDGQLTSPAGIAADPEGTLWIADTGNGRVQEWSQFKPTSGIANTEITVDGKRVDFNNTGCTAEHCTVTREWTLDPSSYAPGKHTILVKATDGWGNTATKSLTVEVQPDTTKPTLETSGELVAAPEGWVEQESYSLNAVATDKDGYGVTALTLKIDSSTVASETKTCPDGGCTATLSKSINMAGYSGGAHSAEIIATDGAGNTTTKHWTINVDPEGHITATEAEDTLEAVDGTSDSTVVAPTDQLLEPEQIEGGDSPGLQQAGPEIKSTGVPDLTTMTTDPEEGFTIHSPEGASTIMPIVSENSSDISIVEGVAGVAPNVGKEVDSVIRPEYNGVQTFQAIRSASSPDSFSWTVKLAKGQALVSVDDQHAEVVYEDGTVAILITAEGAHDATGAEVPTSLEVAGNVLTHKVDFHSGTFVYPIVAGQGWEMSYRVPVIVQGPEDEAEIKQREKEERERAEREALEGGEGAAPPAPQLPVTPAQAERLTTERILNDNVVAPPYPPDGASASIVRIYTVKERYVCQADHCAIWRVWIKNPSFYLGSNWAMWESGTQVHCGYHYDTVYVLIGLSVAEEGCDFAGKTKVFKGEDKHLTIWTRHTISQPFVTAEIMGTKTLHLALLVWVWPNGFQQEVVRHFDPAVLEA